MKAIMTLESGYKTIIDFLTPPLRKRFETQAEFESRKATYPKALRLSAASILF